MALGSGLVLESAKCLWILGRLFGFCGCVWDSGKCFCNLGRVLDSGKCFVLTSLRRLTCLVYMYEYDTLGKSVF